MEKNYGELPGLDVRVYPLKEPQGNLLAMASVTIAESFAVRGLRVLEGKKGPFVSMPQAKSAKGEWRDICFPVTKEAREELNHAVLNCYRERLEETRAEMEMGKHEARSPASPPLPPTPQRGEAR